MIGYTTCDILYFIAYNKKTLYIRNENQWKLWSTCSPSHTLNAENRPKKKMSSLHNLKCPNPEKRTIRLVGRIWLTHKWNNIYYLLCSLNCMTLGNICKRNCSMPFLVCNTRSQFHGFLFFCSRWVWLSRATSGRTILSTTVWISLSKMVHWASTHGYYNVMCNGSTDMHSHCIISSIILTLPIRKLLFMALGLVNQTPFDIVEKQMHNINASNTYLDVTHRDHQNA